MKSLFQEANAGFRSLLSNSTQQLKALANKLGSCIEKSRPYYDALEGYKNAQENCQEAAAQYQKAFGMLDCEGCVMFKNSSVSIV